MGADVEKKISRQVGWLNYNAGLIAPILCTEVLPLLVQVGLTQAMKILKDVEQVAPNITNPTSYVWVAATNAGSRNTLLSVASRPKQLPVAAGPSDPTGKIARQVGWLNQHAGLKEKISFTDVVEPLSKIDISNAMKILKDLEERANHVEHPTAYVVAAASRVAPSTALQGDKRAWVPGVATMPNAKPFSDDQRRIARQVGWLNQHAGLIERISYSDVKEPLEALDLHTAMRLMKDIETMFQVIRNPTAYLLSAARRAMIEGHVRGGISDEAQRAQECWDFMQGHCPRGDTCRYLHEEMAAAAPEQAVAETAQMARSFGFDLNEQALLDLASIPPAECKVLLQ